jgi:EcoRII C terminal/Restriction endonuclease EcoRII, N-terminal
MSGDLRSWLNEIVGFGYVWYVKRLSGNDTLANGSHQAGPYIPKEFLFSIFPSLNRPSSLNPDLWVEFDIDSHEDRRRIRIIWYNNKLHGKTRNEARLTNFGGSNSPLLDPENTGALAVFAFAVDGRGVASECHIWVCRDVIEEALVEDLIGPVEPGTWTIRTASGTVTSSLPAIEKRPSKAKCWLDAAQIPAGWLKKFPSGQEIIRKTVEISPATGKRADLRLLQRRACEYEIFRSIEEVIELPEIKKGFSRVDEFIAKAQTILQRRKARSGRSLELHMTEIFLEEGLKEGRDFSHQPKSESGKRPDFLFPSESSYRDSGFAAGKLRMLAVKTTCKDRWRQILNEADRISKKHLLTLQEGISENQFREMEGAGVQLVVPQPLIQTYPKKVQPHLVTIDAFIDSIRHLYP